MDTAVAISAINTNQPAPAKIARNSRSTNASRAATLARSTEGALAAAIGATLFIVACPDF